MFAIFVNTSIKEELVCPWLILAQRESSVKGGEEFADIDWYAFGVS